MTTPLTVQLPFNRDILGREFVPAKRGGKPAGDRGHWILAQEQNLLVVPEAGGLTLRVEDMTCGHCAGTIKKAVEAALPGTQVDPDPATKLVVIRGTTDLPAVRAAIAAAGYTPSAA